MQRISPTVSGDRAWKSQRTGSVLFLIWLAASIAPMTHLSPSNAQPAVAQSIDSEAFEKASQMIRQAVESGRAAGVSHLVWHRGKVVHFDATGVRDVEDQSPLTRDTIARIYSMTKPITSVAAMTLYQKGKFKLDDPVSDFIPEFKDIQVFRGEGAALKSTSPKRPITIRDAFRHTTGYGYGAPDRPGLAEIYRREQMNYTGPMGMFPPKINLEQMGPALAKIPLLHQPGERFTYGFSTDLLGRLIEIWSGETLDVYIEQAVLKPLEMNDTGFVVDAENQDRFASVHTKQDGKFVIADKAETSPYLDGFEFLSGGGGMVSTIDDYAKFCAMLVTGGGDVLTEKTLKLMFENQLDEVPGPFQFGLGFMIRPVQLGTGDKQGEFTRYSWAGYASTDFQVVPEAELFQIMFRQRIPTANALAQEVFAVIHDGVQLGTKEPDQNKTDSANVFWPGWMGPGRDGWVAGMDQSLWNDPTKLPSELETKWQVDVGTGYATPIVVDGVIYQHARQGDEEVLVCLDLETGQTRWRKSYPVAFKMGGGAAMHGKGPKANAIFADGRVFTFSINGILSAWDATNGDLLWRRDRSEQFERTHPYWGACTSPIVDQDRVIAAYGNDKAGVLVAHDVATGNVVWEIGEDGASYSSPIIAELEGVRQVIYWNHRALIGVESKSGKLLWEQPFEHEGTNQNMPTPILWKDRLLVGGENRGYFSFSPKRDGQTWSVSEDWYQSKVALNMGSAVVNDDLIIGLSHYGRGRLFCLDAETGEVRWQGPGRAAEYNTMLKFPGHIVSLMDDGELKIIRVDSQELDEVRSYDVGPSKTWTAPVLLPDGFLVKGKDKLTYWTFQTG